MKIITKNRNARFNYQIIDTFDTGLVLSGTEIKSIDFRRGEDGEAKITVELSDSSSIVDLQKRDGKILIDFIALIASFSPAVAENTQILSTQKQRICKWGINFFGSELFEFKEN